MDPRLRPILLSLVMLAGCAASATPATSPTVSPPPTVSTPPTATESPQPTQAPVATPAPTPVPSIALLPWPTLDPAAVLGNRLRCSLDADSPSFSVATFNSASPVAPADDSPEVRAMRRAIGEGALRSLEWRLVAKSTAAAVFVAAGPNPGLLWFISVVPDSRPLHEGAWIQREQGDCRLQVVVADDRSRAEVWLDPARLPKATDRVLHLLISETACSGGALPTGRVLPPTVVLSAETITILITVARLPGEQDCPGVDPTPYSVTLPEAIGRRRILDGGLVLPTPITAPRPNSG